VCAGVGGGLEQSANDHDYDTRADGFLAADLLAEDGGRDAAEKTSYFVDGDYEAGDCGGWVVEGVVETGGVDESAGVRCAVGDLGN
jgi:hypothetical protein